MVLGLTVKMKIAFAVSYERKNKCYTKINL